jgi:hypothetical protein
VKKYQIKIISKDELQYLFKAAPFFKISLDVELGRVKNIKKLLAESNEEELDLLGEILSNRTGLHTEVCNRYLMEAKKCLNIQ